MMIIYTTTTTITTTTTTTTTTTNYFCYHYDDYCYYYDDDDDTCDIHQVQICLLTRQHRWLRQRPYWKSRAGGAILGGAGRLPVGGPVHQVHLRGVRSLQPKRQPLRHGHCHLRDADDWKSARRGSCALLQVCVCVCVCVLSLIHI